MSDRPMTGLVEPRLPPRSLGWRLCWRRLARMVRAVRTRRDLAEREPRLLDDIGLSRANALVEASRAPWDLAPPPRQSAARRMGTPIGEAWRRRYERALLSRLDGYEFRDLGIGTADRAEEANKPFWRR